MEYRFLWFVSTCNYDFEANSTSLMSLWANIKFFPEPTGELYGWLLATLVKKDTSVNPCSARDQNIRRNHKEVLYKAH